MSVQQELQLLKQPSNYQGAVVPDGSMIYIKNLSLYFVAAESTGRKVYELQNKNANSIIHIASHPNWGEKNKVCVLLFDSGSVCSYDLNLNRLEEMHNEHKSKAAIAVGRIHLTAQGIIITAVQNIISRYCMLSKQLRVFPNLLPKNFNVTEMSVSTGPADLMALGSYDGRIEILLLEGMTTYQRCRCHDYQVTGFVWLNRLNGENTDGQASKTDEQDTRSQESELLDSEDAETLLPVDVPKLHSLQEKLVKMSLTGKRWLVSIDQHMNVSVWDLFANCEKGNFKIPLKKACKTYKVKTPVFPVQMHLLHDNGVIIGNDCTSNQFEITLTWDDMEHKLLHTVDTWDCEAILMGVTADSKYYAYYPHHSLKLMAYTGPRTGEIVRRYTTYNGTGRSIAVSPMNQMRIAIGTNEICQCDLASVTDDSCTFTTYNKNIRNSVVCITWHPEREVLAFGTVEGRVGIFDTVSRNVQLLKSFSGVEIYDLAFARMNSDDKYVLFATSGGTSIIYTNNLSQVNHVFRNITDVSSLCVDNDAHKVLVGNKVGNIYCFDVDADLIEPNLLPLRISKKYIRQFVFNCDRTKIAVTNKTPQIAIVSYSDFDLMQTDTSPAVLHLKSHTSAIVWCDFSPSKPNLLLSASYDNSIKLWQLSTSSDGAAADSGDVDYTVIASFEFNRIIRYAIFSPLNEDCLIVGTHSTPFYVFNTKAKLNDFPPTISTVEVAKMSTVKAPFRQSQVVAMDVGTDVTSGDSSTAGGANGVENVDGDKESTKPSHDPSKPILKNESTVLYLTKKELSKKALKCAAAILTGVDEEEECYLNKKLFTSNLDDVQDLLRAEVRNYRNSSLETSGHALIALMNNTLTATVTEHVKAKTLTDELVALAPMISYNFWLNCTQSYAMQLIESGHPLKAVLHLLAIHEVDGAITVLQDKGYYREAWILGRLKKAADDPIFIKIADKWIRDLDSCGDYEAAAVIATGISDYETALEQLSKRREDKLTVDHHTVIRLLNERLQK